MKPRTIYAEDLERRAALDAKIKSLRSEAKNLAQKLAAEDKAIEAYLRDNMGADKTLTRSGWRLALATKRKGVSWKQVVLDKLGVGAAQEAEQAAGEAQYLVIEPVSKKAREAAG